MSSSQRSIATSTSSNSTSSSTVVDASGRILTGKYLEKASSKNDLVVRLRKILRLLRDDDNIEPDSDEYPGLAALCHSLTRYVNHRDKEVRLYTVAACMELFTVYAPEAPWNELETIDIFKQTIRQLANLAHSTGGDSRGKSTTDLSSSSSSSSGPHFYQYYRILELLAEVKIAVVLVDLSKKNDDISDDDDDVDDDSDIVDVDSDTNRKPNSLSTTRSTETTGTLTLEEEAMEIKQLFDIDQMGYNVMINERTKRYQDGKINPQQLIDAIKEDFMFGDEFTEFCHNNDIKNNKNNDNNNNEDNNNVIQILEIGKYSDDFTSSAPLPTTTGTSECNLTIQEKGNYLLHISLTKEISTTMRIVVD